MPADLPSLHSDAQRNAPTDLVNVGLVGGGWIADLAHLQSLAASNRARLVAIVETDPVRQAELQRRLPTVVFPTLDELLNDAAIPAVIVAVPTPLHGSMAVAAFSAGKHVYLEKPLAATVAEGEAIVDAWRHVGTVGMVGYNFRYSPTAEHASRVLFGHELGTLLDVQSQFVWPAGTITGWRAHPEQGGGCLLDLASHHVDLIVELAESPVRTVRCTTRSIRTAEDSATLHLTLKNGVNAQLFASFVAGVASNQIQLFGTEGCLTVDLYDPITRDIQRPPGQGARFERMVQSLKQLHPARLLHHPGQTTSFARSLEAFVAAVGGGPRPASTPSTALEVLRVIEAARESAAQNGAPVTLEAPRSLSPDPSG